jgi:predicted RNase H-like HicB family nuclease
VNQIVVSFTATLPAQTSREGRCWVAFCPVLDVGSQGRSEAEALKHLGEALRLFLTDCWERGTLERVLKDCGFAPAAASPSTAPRRRSSKAPALKLVEVALPFVVAAASDPCRA